MLGLPIAQPGYISVHLERLGQIVSPVVLVMLVIFTACC